MKNYIADINRFHLAKPPLWRLRQLMEFDPSIVLIPSREESYLILAQRNRTHSLPKRIDEHIVRPDEAMLRAYGLVNPLKLVSVTGGWDWSSAGSDLRPHLVARSAERLGGFEKVIKAVEQQDENDRLQRLKYRRDDILDPRIRAGARAAQMRTGSRILNAGPATVALSSLDSLARSAQRASSAPSGSTPQRVSLT